MSNLGNKDMHVAALKAIFYRTDPAVSPDEAQAIEAAIEVMSLLDQLASRPIGEFALGVSNLRGTAVFMVEMKGEQVEYAQARDQRLINEETFGDVSQSSEDSLTTQLVYALSSTLRVHRRRLKDSKG